MFVASHVKFYYISMTPPLQKMIPDAIDLSVVLERTVRFLTAVDVVLEEYIVVWLTTNDWVLNMLR